MKPLLSWRGCLALRGCYALAANVPSQRRLRHAGLVQSFQLFERYLEVVPDQSSHVPLSRREEADRAVVGVEQFEARSTDHVAMTGNPEQLFDQIGLSVGEFPGLLRICVLEGV
jgi:hypothetical protein